MIYVTLCRRTTGWAAAVAVLLSVSRLWAEEVVIGTWNIRMLSAQSRTGAERSRIADLLQTYDLVALQEARDDSVVSILVDTLRARGLDVAMLQGPAQGVPPADERYAFVYRRDRVQLGELQVWPDTDGAFVRPPCWVRFQAGTFDGILVTVHLVYGEREDDRRAEARLLPAVLRGVAASDPEELDLILAGDFNLDSEDSGFADLSATMVPLFPPGTGTTIADHDLDNIWLDRDHTREYTGASGVVRFDETMYGGDDTQASLEVSDHRPVWARFAGGARDDDGREATTVIPRGWGAAKAVDGR